MDEEPFIIIIIVYFCLYLFLIPPISKHKKHIVNKDIEEARVKKNNLMKREKRRKEITK